MCSLIDMNEPKIDKNLVSMGLWSVVSKYIAIRKDIRL